MEVQFDGRTLPPITVSIGVAQATAGVPDAGELLSRSDAGLYQAKQQGRNRVAMAAV
jgi:diguanylate cyclase (GGDEF)-like protein